MSPEQASADNVDGRSDLYALGLVAWYGVTGVRADLPAPLADAIDRLLQKDPLHRFQTAEALVDAIDAAQLAAPEIPLPVRLFQQHGKSFLVYALPVVLFTAMNWWRCAPDGVLDRLTTISVAVALEIVLLITSAFQARSLRQLGFDHAARAKASAPFSTKATTRAPKDSPCPVSPASVHGTFWRCCHSWRSARMVCGAGSIVSSNTNPAISG